MSEHTTESSVRMKLEIFTDYRDINIRCNSLVLRVLRLDKKGS